MDQQAKAVWWRLLDGKQIQTFIKLLPEANKEPLITFTLPFLQSKYM